MKIELETEILGNFKIDQDFDIKYHPYNITIKYDYEKDAHIITLNRSIKDFNAFIPKFKLNNERINSIIFPKEDFLFEEIKLLQHIESFGAIDRGIERIKWDRLIIRWIPETEDERKELPISEYERKLSYDFPKSVLTKKWLTDTIIHRRQMGDLHLQFSFYREGVNFFHNFQYQNAFLNFFLMLEGFFGNGKHKTHDLEREFSKSDILEYAINETLIKLSNQNGTHHKWLIQKAKKYEKPIDKSVLISEMIKVRGSLSHFSIKSQKIQRNPYNDRDYESLAFIAMSICLYATIKLRLEPFRKNT